MAVDLIAVLQPLAEDLSGGLEGLPELGGVEDDAGLLRAQRGLAGELVLGGGGEAVGLGTFFGEGAHQAALLVSIFKAVEEHVIEHLAVAQPIAAARQT